MVCMCCLVEIPATAKVKLCVSCFQHLVVSQTTPHFECTIHNRILDPTNTGAKR